MPVDPGPWENAELVAVLRLLLRTASLRETIGSLARDHVRSNHRLETSATRLADFLTDVGARRPEQLSRIRAETVEGGPIIEYFADEIRFAVRGLGLGSSSLGLEARLGRLADRRESTDG